MIDCHHYQKGDCRSCQWLEMPYEQQLAKKEEHLKQQLAKLDCDDLIWHPPFYSSESAFRNKAKMVVSGAVERPILGILQDPNDPQSAVDLCDCPLYPQRFAELFPILKDFIMLLEKVRLQLRLSIDFHLLSYRQYACLVQLLEKIMKQAVSWLKSERRKINE